MYTVMVKLLYTFEIGNINKSKW